MNNEVELIRIVVRMDPPSPGSELFLNVAMVVMFLMAAYLIAGLANEMFGGSK